MRFTKPINRELEIDGSTYIVSMGETGIDLRVKGKRKGAHVGWAEVLLIAQAEDAAPRGTSPEADVQPEASEAETGTEDSSADLSRTAAAGEHGPESQ